MTKKKMETTMMDLGGKGCLRLQKSNINMNWISKTKRGMYWCNL